MMCPICKRGSDYTNYGWFERHMIREHNWTPEEALEWWKYHCPFCGKPIADSIIMCWNCKEILDPNLLRLAEGYVVD